MPVLGGLLAAAVVLLAPQWAAMFLCQQWPAAAVARTVVGTGRLDLAWLGLARPCLAARVDRPAAGPKSAALERPQEEQQAGGG